MKTTISAFSDVQKVLMIKKYFIFSGIVSKIFYTWYFSAIPTLVWVESAKYKTEKLDTYLPLIASFKVELRFIAKYLFSYGLVIASTLIKQYYSYPSSIFIIFSSFYTIYLNKL